jgi:cyclase
MSLFRVIARLDIKSGNLIKGMHLEGLRVVGDPAQFAQKYYKDGIDELIFIDAVASLYGRNHLLDFVKKTTKEVFIPITVGGGIRSINDVDNLLRAGADKVAINTAVVKRPDLITEITNKYGSQCLVLSIQAKQVADGDWNVFIENGRENTGISVSSWVVDAVARGVGEVLITSIDQEGTRRGFDVNLLKMITGLINVPVIASGGMGEVSHVIDAHSCAGIDAIAIADVFHYNRLSVMQLKKQMLDLELQVRNI